MERGGKPPGEGMQDGGNSPGEGTSNGPALGEVWWQNHKHLARQEQRYKQLEQRHHNREDSISNALHHGAGIAIQLE